MKTSSAKSETSVTTYLEDDEKTETISLSESSFSISNFNETLVLIRQALPIFAKKFKQTLELIRFSHSIFALPFALASMFIAAEGIPSLKVILLIIGCMICARTSAMAFNRYIDAEYDALNPRTRDRHIPKGLFSPEYVLRLAIGSGLAFIGLTAFLNTLCLILSVPALAIVWGYSYAKRFTHFAQLFLGLALAISPIGAWVAVRNSIDTIPLLLGAAVAFWVAGFDIFYATADRSFDEAAGLKSLVVRFGIENSLLIARAFHLFTVLILLVLATSFQLPIIYLCGCIIVIAALAYEHSLVTPDDLSQIDEAFFTMNGWVGIIFFVSTSLSVHLASFL